MRKAFQRRGISYLVRTNNIFGLLQQEARNSVDNRIEDHRLELRPEVAPKGLFVAACPLITEKNTVMAFCTCFDFPDFLETKSVLLM